MTSLLLGTPVTRACTAVTLTALRVMLVMLSRPERPVYARLVCASTRVPPGSAHRTLSMLEDAGWAVSRFEPLDVVQARRPPRRWYTLTPDGAVRARQELAALQALMDAGERGMPAVQVTAPSRGDARQTPQHAVLEELRRVLWRGQRASEIQLARVAGLDRALVTALLEDLCAQKMVSRRPFREMGVYELSPPGA